MSDNTGSLKECHEYDDIIDMEHHQSKKHPRMAMYKRAAQFAPFSALTGYEEAVQEMADKVERSWHHEAPGQAIDDDDVAWLISDNRIQKEKE